MRLRSCEAGGAAPAGHVLRALTIAAGGDASPAGHQRRSRTRDEANTRGGTISKPHTVAAAGPGAIEAPEALLLLVRVSLLPQPQGLGPQRKR